MRWDRRAFTSSSIRAVPSVSITIWPVRSSWGSIRIQANRRSECSSALKLTIRRPIARRYGLMSPMMSMLSARPCQCRLTSNYADLLHVSSTNADSLRLCSQTQTQSVYHTDLCMSVVFAKMYCYFASYAIAFICFLFSWKFLIPLHSTLTK